MYVRTKPPSPSSADSENCAPLSMYRVDHHVNNEECCDDNHVPVASHFGLQARLRV